MRNHLLEEDEPDYQLFALIVQSIEEYRLVYLINKNLNINLVREKDITITRAEIEYRYANYQFFDESKDRHYHLIKNSPYTHSIKENSSTLATLFVAMPMLIKEWKNYPFLLKVEPKPKQPMQGIMNGKSPILEAREIKNTTFEKIYNLAI